MNNTPNLLDHAGKILLTTRLAWLDHPAKRPLPALLLVHMPEDTQVLESALNEASVVICQTGCISHDHFWRVDSHCKRTGKQCVFIKEPIVVGPSSLTSDSDSPDT